MELKYPQWQEALAAALLEFNSQQLRGKLQRAEEAITKDFKNLNSRRTTRRNFGCSRTDSL
jgi:hypothetical protein